MTVNLRSAFCFAACVPFLLPLALQAQPGIITFTGVREGTAQRVILDSILVRNLAQGRDTMLIRTASFDIGWLTGIGDARGFPADFTLRCAYREAAGGKAVLRLSLPRAGRVRLAAWSVLGAELASATADLAGGTQSIVLDIGGAASGTYLVTASAGGETRSVAVALLRGPSTGPARISVAGAAAPAGAAASAHGAAGWNATDAYTFIGYARACAPDTIANVVPVKDRNYEFSFEALPPNGMILGPPVQVAATQILSLGGRVSVSDPGTPLTGMQITVPALSYPDARTFTVSYADIIAHNLDSTVTLLSPLITISNGGGYADSAMLVKIPIRLPAGYFAMAFMVDRDSCTLEGLPIVALTDDAVYVATRHFSGDQAGFRKSVAAAMPRPWVDVLVAGIKSEELTGTITSNFTPGTDDWEFINWGSYLAPGGHCTGQSLTAMWYYLNKKERGGAPALHDLMDQAHADSMWMDNTRGYRFASVVWAGLNWTGRSNWLDNYFQHVGTSKISRDSLHYLAFAFAIRNTGHPQLTEIWRLAAGKWYGHAMVVYGVDKGTLRIADPNYPGTARSTKLNAGSFVPYSSGDNAGNLGEQYPDIQYIAQSAIASTANIGERWKQTFAGTIGTVPPNTFPATTLFLLKNGNPEPLPDRVETMKDSVFVAATCPTCADKLPGDRTPLLLTDEKGKFITWSDPDGTLRVPSPPGTTKYGVTVYGYAGPGKSNLGYIDFRWLTVSRKTYVAASVESGPLDGHFRNEYDSAGTLVTKYSDNAVEMTSLTTGWEGPIHGTFSNNVYTSDTTYKLGGYFTHTEHISITLNDSLTEVLSYTISHTRLQDGDWTDNTTITGGHIRLEPNGSTEDYDRFLFEGEGVCSHITKVEYTDQRLDRVYRSVLESFTCRATTRIRISLTKW